MLRDIDEEGIPNYAIRKQGRSTYVGQFTESETLDIDGQFLYTYGSESSADGFFSWEGGNP